jgi:Cu-Zn family superoxide dismutase
MRYRLFGTLGGAAAIAAACTTSRTVETSVEPIQSARAELRDALGRELGTVRVLLTSTGARVAGALTGLPAGEHGFHIHEAGRSDGAGPTPFESAGGHYNPAARQHGTLNPAGPHAGDLPNVAVGADGRATLPDSGVTAAMTDAAKAGLFDANGSALVVHARADDYRTDPSGSSGARVACGVIVR